MTDNVLKPRQQIALSALLTGSNIEQAAESASVDPRTLRRWMNDEEFKNALDLAQADLSRQAARRLANLLTDSVDELEKLLKSSQLQPFERLRVIQTILNTYPRFHEVVTLDDRLDRLERMLSNE